MNSEMAYSGRMRISVISLWLLVRSIIVSFLKNTLFTLKTNNEKVTNFLFLTLQRVESAIKQVLLPANYCNPCVCLCLVLLCLPVE